MNRNKITVQDYLEIIIHYKLQLVFVFILGTLVAIAYSYYTPLIYRSSTLILVEPQKIPSSYVNPIITSTVQERLATISQQILSRTNLEKIILQFALYEPESNAGKPSVSEFDQKVKTYFSISFVKILTYMNLRHAVESTPLEVLVERMRKDIEVKVMSGGSAFTVSYEAKDPIVAMKVTNTLASLFIEENLKLREQQAEGTSEFLESQLQEAKNRLEKQEKKLKEFKELRMGSLPGQIDANLKTLDRLQLELQTINEGLRNAEERKISIDRLRQDLNNFDQTSRVIRDPIAVGQLGTNTDLHSIKIRQLKGELARLQSEFKDHYPDIILLKKEISELERQIGRAADPQTMPRSSTSSSRSVDSSRAQQLNPYSTEIQTLNSDIEAM